MYSFHTVKKMLSRCSVYWIMYACVLGVQISQDLSWDPNTSGSIKQAQQSRRFLRSWNKPLSLSLLKSSGPFYRRVTESILHFNMAAGRRMPDKKDRQRIVRVVERVTGCSPPLCPTETLTVSPPSDTLSEWYSEILSHTFYTCVGILNEATLGTFAHDSERLPRIFISTRLYNCNSSRTCLYKMSLNRLQIGQNAAARVLSKTSSCFHIAPTLPTLHCLPVKFIIYSKKNF